MVIFSVLLCVRWVVMVVDSVQLVLCVCGVLMQVWVQMCLVLLVVMSMFCSMLFLLVLDVVVRCLFLSSMVWGLSVSRLCVVGSMLLVVCILWLSSVLVFGRFGVIINVCGKSYFVMVCIVVLLLSVVLLVLIMIGLMMRLVIGWCFRVERMVFIICGVFSMLVLVVLMLMLFVMVLICVVMMLGVSDFIVVMFSVFCVVMVVMVDMLQQLSVVNVFRLVWMFVLLLLFELVMVSMCGMCEVGVVNVVRVGLVIVMLCECVGGVLYYSVIVVGLMCQFLILEGDGFRFKCEVKIVECDGVWFVCEV